MRDEIERVRQLQQVLAKATGAPTLRQFARVIVEDGVVAVDAQMAALWMIDDTGDVLDLWHWAGHPHASSFGKISVDSDAPIALAVRTRTPIWISNRAGYAAAHPQSATRATRATQDTGELSFASLPLVSHGRAIGGLVLAFFEDYEFDSDERASLEAFARQCAHIIEMRRMCAAEAEARRQADLARAEAEAANRAKDEFLAMLGHELRNPLAPIVASLSSLRIRANGGELGFEHTIVERQVRQLVRLVDDLLDLAQINRDGLQLRRAPVELAEVVSQALEEVSTRIVDRGHHLTIEVPDGIVVDADSQRLIQVLANLLANAAKYTPRNGRIELVASTRDGFAQIVVRDNGIGIAPELLSQMFGMFVQGNRGTDRRDSGLGLGLAIVKNLVDRHGGRVTATSAGPGCGTEVTVAWPLSSEPTQPIARIPFELDDHALRVLVVDNHVDSATTLGELLSALGHHPTVVHDASSALATAQTQPPALMLVDIELPDLDGYELARRMRALPGLSVLPVIAVSGHARPSDVARTRSEGFVEHLIKPVALHDLRGVLGTVAR